MVELPKRSSLAPACIFVAYFLAGKAGLSFAALHSSASAIWPPTGIALAAFLLFGYRVWPAIFLGALLVNWTTAGSLWTSAGIAAGNTLEGVAGAFLVHRYAGGMRCLETAGNVFRFAALAAVLATTVSATVGVSVLALGGYADWGDFGALWLTWWLGDATGALVVAPLLLLWYANPRPVVPAARAMEAILIFAAVVLVAVLCFTLPLLRDYPLIFLCLPPLAWIALRFGSREVATAIFLLSVVAVWATEWGLGPFVMSSRNESLLVLQAFIGMVAVTMLPMSALVEEHRRAIVAAEYAGELERRARGEAEEATRSRDEFLAMLSHELRNPLQAISSALAVLQRQGAGSEPIGRAVGILTRQTDHLGRLVNDLLDVARVITGKIVLVRQAVNLGEAVGHCVGILKTAGKLDHHRVEVETPDIWLNADPARVEQVISNLLHNALKFTPRGGTIRVEVRSEGDQAVLQVSDDGIGIEPELLARVFDLFTQGKKTLDRREGGLGVGLTLVRRLVELHGGSVTVRSRGLGQGSEFIVQLPASARMDDSRAGAAAAEPRGKPRRVLLVEDNADARESLRECLALEGHEVEVAEDGESALQIAARTCPDIVLVDIGLPGMDGYEVARRLRTSQDASAVRSRLVALTGYGREEDVKRARAAGFDEHLTKPVHPQAVQRLMDAIECEPEYMSGDRSATASAGIPGP